MNKLNIFFSGLLLFCFLNISVYAQEDEPDNRPVRKPFSCTMLVDNQTIISPSKGSLELVINHRFGNFENGISDLFGIYAASNIRMGLQYGISNKLMVGFGTEKVNKMNEFFWKYAIIQQTRSGSVPVSVSYFGNMVIDSREEAVFGLDYAFADRMSYFNQVIVARKFSKKFSLQATTSYSHMNAVDSVWQNSELGISIGGKVGVTKKMNVIFEYDQPLSIKSRQDYQHKIEPNYALGIEIATSTHAFQVFVANYENIIPQKNYLFNTNKLDDDGISIGFNITVRF